MTRVLIIEPESAFQQLLASNLNLRGYHVIILDNPARGYQEVVACSPKIIVLDMAFNNDDSRIFLNQLSVNQRMIPVIITTTIHQRLEIEHEYGYIKHILRKPFAVENLLTLVSTLAI